MNSLRDRHFRLFKPSSPVDPIAAIAIPLLLVVAALILGIFMFTVGAATTWLRGQQQAPIVHQLPERGR